MTLTKQSLEELKQKARVATPGPWIAEDEKDNGSRTPFAVNIGALSTDDWIAQCIPIHEIKYMDGYVEGENKQQNAYYIAAASPDVVLDLIARVEELQKALEFYSEKSLYRNRRSHPENHSTDLEWDSGYTAQEALESFGVK